MILFQINAAGLTICKFKCEAPRAVDMNRVARRVKPGQRMKIEPREVHFLWPRNNIQSVQPDQITAVKTCIDS